MKNIFGFIVDGVIVIFGRDSDRVQSAIRIIVECKKSTINPSATKDGIEQLKSYMSLCVNCEWGMWTNSVQRFVFRKVEDRATGERIFEEYNDIPSAEGNIAEIDRPTRNDLKNAVDDITPTLKIPTNFEMFQTYYSDA